MPAFAASPEGFCDVDEGVELLPLGEVRQLLSRAGAVPIASRYYSDERSATT
jgi:hypothetical protein